MAPDHRGTWRDAHRKDGRQRVQRAAGADAADGVQPPAVGNWPPRSPLRGTVGCVGRLRGIGFAEYPPPMRSALAVFLGLLLPLTAAEPPWLDPDSPLPGKLQQRLAELSPGARGQARARLRQLRLPAAEATEIAIDIDGEPHFTCNGLCRDEAHATDEAPTSDSTGSPVIAAAAVPLGEAPRWHSRAGAARIIVLDFDGEVVEKTAWNKSAGVARWRARPYDLDGDETTFSSSEITAMHRIWERVAEDFAPFAVDVTNEPPVGGFGPTVGRLLVTRDTDADGRDCPAKGGGGVAYVGVWGISNYTSYQPAWVYFNRLGSGRADYVAEAASHEMGHNLGLRHDGTATSTYYAGQGSGETSWAPIMGVAYGRQISQWSRGEYAGANNQEDDLAIIAGRLTYRADDHPDASPVDLSPDALGAIAASGVMAASGDADVFAFTTAAGTIDLTVSPFVSAAHTRGGNLDIRLDLVDAAGDVVATADRSDRTGATLSLDVAAGTYALRVTASCADGVYPLHGSRGAFALSGTIVPLPPDTTAPDAPTTLTAVADGAGALLLAWSAPGDDGATGTASAYQLRRADAPIADDAAWDSATPVADLPAPAPAGTTQSLRLGGLDASRTYHLALRAVDDAGNAGARAPAQATTALPAFALSPAVVTAMGDGLVATFAITLDAPSASATSVAFSTRDGTAVSPVDYVATTVTIAFAAGQTQGTVSVPAQKQTAPKVFSGTLSEPADAELAVEEADALLPGTAGSSSADGGGGGGSGSGGCGGGSGIALLTMLICCLGCWRSRPA